MVSTSVQRSNAHILHTEVMSLLTKGAVETVSPAQSESGFYSLPRPQEGWWSKTHSRYQTSESRPYETDIQDDYIETDPLTNMRKGLVLFAGS